MIKRLYSANYVWATLLTFVMTQFNELPQDVILHIFAFISYTFLRRSVCRVCKTWHRISDDPAILKKAPSQVFESIRLFETLTNGQLKNSVQTIIWARTEDIDRRPMVNQ